MGDNDFSVEHTGVRVRQMAGTLERVVKYDAVTFPKAWNFLASSDDEDDFFFFFFFVELFSPEREQNMAFWGATVFFAAVGPCRVRACVNDVPKIKIGKNQNQNWALIGRGSKPPDYASLFFGNRCQTKKVPRDLGHILWGWKFKILEN